MEDEKCERLNSEVSYFQHLIGASIQDSCVRNSLEYKSRVARGVYTWRVHWFQRALSGRSPTSVDAPVLAPRADAILTLALVCACALALASHRERLAPAISVSL